MKKYATLLALLLAFGSTTAQASECLDPEAEAAMEKFKEKNDQYNDMYIVGHEKNLQFLHAFVKAQVVMRRGMVSRASVERAIERNKEMAEKVYKSFAYVNPESDAVYLWAEDKDGCQVAVGKHSKMLYLMAKKIFNGESI